MCPGQRRCRTPSWGADHEAFAHQERLSDGLNGLRLLPDRDGQGAQADGATTEAATQGLQHGAIQPVKAAVVDVEQGQRGMSGLLVGNPLTVHLRPVAHPA